MSPDVPRDENKGPTGEKPVGPKKYVYKLQPEQSRPEGIQVFSSVRPAYRCLPIGSLGGRDTITSLAYQFTAQPFKF
jgi:hypothetical protein